MENLKIATILREMAVFYEMDGVLFKPQAYERAAQSIESLGEDIANVYKKNGTKSLTEISGVGKGIADHIEKILLGKHFSEYEELKKKVPVNVSELISVEGVGPRTVKVLWQKLKIRDLAGLEKAAREGKLKDLPRFGERLEKKILKGIELLKKSGGRATLGFALPEVRIMEKVIQDFPEVDQVIIAGSIRRRKETVGDIDILVVSENPEKVMDRFVALPQVAHVYAKGKTKTLVKLKNRLDADIRVVPQESFGTALNYFTGSKDHNVALREIAIKKGMKFNEYGLFRGKKIIAGKTEEELYKALGLQYIEPEIRENLGEIEMSKQNKLPKLIGYTDLKGDLQVQTDWTDGEDSIEIMAHAAMEYGLEYIAITDHTKSLAMTGGSDEKKLLKQMAEIDRINKKLKSEHKSFRILKGAEVNIMKDGSLDIIDEVLAKLDVVGAAVHSHFKLSLEEQTQRVLRAVQNPHVDIIFHLTGRLIHRRDPIELDIEKIIETAKRRKTVLEIDAYPDRLDIRDEYIRKCVQKGVRMSIDSDAHSKEHFKLLEYGAAQARRGWATKEDIINTRSAEEMLKLLK